MAVFGEFGDTMTPDPEINVHVPVPTAGVFPAITVAVAQITWLGPALDGVGFASRCIDIVDVVDPQAPLLMVHWKTFTPH